MEMEKIVPHLLHRHLNVMESQYLRIRSPAMQQIMPSKRSVDSKINRSTPVINKTMLVMK